MFKVIEKKTGQVTEVYDVSRNNYDGPTFLVYTESEFEYRPARNYRPVTEEDLQKEFLEKLKYIPTVLQPAPPPVQVICQGQEPGYFANVRAAEEGQDERLEGLCAYGPLTRLDDEGSV